jgi:hypothetical protein
LHRKSNHIYTVWQHIVLVTIRQYEGKSYRMFTDWLVEAYYLRLFLQLSKIPHYTTLQKFTDRINITMLDRIISSFILFTGTSHIFAGIDATGFKIIYASEYYTNKAKLRKKYAKLSIGADVLQQLVCSVKIRRAPTRHDNVDFKPIVTKILKIKKLSIVVADKAYDSEENHKLVRENLHGFSIMPPRYEQVPVWKTAGKYRKEMKRGYNKILYNQRNKDETIVSVIKRLFGEHINSILVRMQNRELVLRCIAYNAHRMVNLLSMMEWFLRSPSFFSYLVNNFLNLLCHEFVLSTTHLLAGCFFCNNLISSSLL